MSVSWVACGTRGTDLGGIEVGSISAAHSSSGILPEKRRLDA